MRKHGPDELFGVLYLPEVVEVGMAAIGDRSLYEKQESSESEGQRRHEPRRYQGRVSERILLSALVQGLTAWTSSCKPRSMRQ